MVVKSNFVGEKCSVYVFAISTKRHAEMVEKLLISWLCQPEEIYEIRVKVFSGQKVLF